jgi:bifunctional lysine-specific demethylase and histidyl-hydroxylase NO66
MPAPRVRKTAVRPEPLVSTTAAQTVARAAEPIPTAVLTAARMPVQTRMAEPTAARMQAPTPTAGLMAALTKAPSARGSALTGDPVQRLTGLPLARFNAEHWGHAPRLHRASAQDEGFTDLFAGAAVDVLLSRRGLRTPFLRMTRDGNVIPSARYTRSGGAGAEISDQVADDKVLAEFSAGATLVLQGLHRTWEPIQIFAVALTEQLGHPAQVNAYVTPPLSQGLTPHYDVHDVFLLQFAGRKHWRVHQPVLASPLREQTWQKRQAAVVARARESPLFDIILEPGDVLYLPRGYIHAATSLDEISGHLTIGIHPITRMALVEQIFAAVSEDVALRASLPAGVDFREATALDHEFAATLEALIVALGRVDLANVTRGIGRVLDAATRPEPLSPLAQFVAAASLAPETRLRLRPGLHVILDFDDEECILHLPDKDLRLPSTAADVVRGAITGSVVAAETLPGADSEGCMHVLADLVRAGVLVPA